MKTIKLKFNKDHLEFKSGQEITIKCDSKKTPLELRFRRLLEDSEIDNTVSIIKPEKTKKPKRQDSDSIENTAED